MTALSPRPNTPSPAEFAPRLSSINAETILDVHQLCVGYSDGPTVLQDLSFTVHRGERLGFIGCNGVGKTTLFQSLCGVIPASSGAITLWGKPVKAGQFHPEIGLVFQNPDDQLFSARVWDDVAFGPQNMGLELAEIGDRVRTALETTGTTELADRAPHHLSGGQKRMVAIAGIVAMQPQLAIFDEPSANLDSRSRRRLIHFLNSQARTFLLASHDLELVLEVCDRVLLLDRGRIVADGPAPEVMGDAALMEAHGLECPHSLTHQHSTREH